MSDWIDIRRQLPWRDRKSLGIIQLVDQTSAGVLKANLNHLGFDLFSIDGKHVVDEASLFNTLSQTFSFPDYFGNNWNAFYDSFGELCYQRSKPMAILWYNADIFMTEATNTFLDTVAVFHDVCRGDIDSDYNDQNVVFFLGDRNRGFIAQLNNGDTPNCPNDRIVG